MYYSNPHGVSVHDGFPNPATDSSLQILDLNTLLIRHRLSTYFMRLDGSEWQELGIFAGDILIIDRALKPRANDLVVWWKSESFTFSHSHVVPEGIPMWGVVTATIHRFRIGQ